MNRSVFLLTTPFRPNVGGVETHLDDLINEGAKRKIKFIIITYQPLVTKATGKTIERGKGYIVYRIPWIRMNLFLKLERYPFLEFIYLFPGLFIFGFLYLLFNSRKIKVIHSQGLVAGAAGLFLGKIFSKEIIVSTHSIYDFPKSGLYSNFIRYMFNSCKAVLCLSRQSKKEVEDLGIPHNKVKVFTYWVNQEIFKEYDKREARRELSLPLNKFICFFVGRLVEVKGVNELMEAAKITKGNILYIVAGDGPLADKVRKVSGRHKNVLFFGKIDNKSLPMYYSAADVLVVPSVHEEGFGRVILEALSCGTPVVGSNRGAIPEAITEEIGKLIKVNPKNIRNAIEELARNPREVKKMSRASRKFAVSKYSSKNIKSILKYYD